jgi:hypothetical protein
VVIVIAYQMPASSSSSPSGRGTPVVDATAPVQELASRLNTVNTPQRERGAPGPAGLSLVPAHTAPPKTRHRPLASRAADVPPDPEAEKALRRSLIAGLPKARRHHDPNQIEICLPPGFLARTEPTGESPPPRVPPAVHESHVPITAALRHNSFPLLNPVTILGAGRINPFAKYPIEITAIDQYILDQCKSRSLIILWLIYSDGDGITSQHLYCTVYTSPCLYPTACIMYQP